VVGQGIKDIKHSEKVANDEHRSLIPRSYKKVAFTLLSDVLCICEQSSSHFSKGTSLPNHVRTPLRAHPDLMLPPSIDVQPPTDAEGLFRRLGIIGI